MFHIIQSIPSPKAEQFNHWLVQDGYKRMREIGYLEPASERTKFIYGPFFSETRT